MIKDDNYVMDALPLYAIDELHEKVKEEKKISNFDVEHFFPVLESFRVIDLRTTFGTEPNIKTVDVCIIHMM